MIRQATIKPGEKKIRFDLEGGTEISNCLSVALDFGIGPATVAVGDGSVAVPQSFA